MASVAPIMPAAAREPEDFRINGCMPFSNETPGEYIRAAHAIACLGQSTLTDDATRCNDQIVSGSFDAIALLLSHAERAGETAGHW